jgi:hypothetical protein
MEGPELRVIDEPLHRDPVELDPVERGLASAECTEDIPRCGKRLDRIFPIHDEVREAGVAANDFDRRSRRRRSQANRALALWNPPVLRLGSTHRL